jgi:hypothetical protein
MRQLAAFLDARGVALPDAASADLEAFLVEAVPVGHEGGIGEGVPNLHSVPEISG